MFLFSFDNESQDLSRRGGLRHAADGLEGVFRKAHNECMQRTAIKSNEMTAPTIMYFFMLAIFFSSCRAKKQGKTACSAYSLKTKRRRTTYGTYAKAVPINNSYPDFDLADVHELSDADHAIAIHIHLLEGFPDLKRNDAR